MKNDPPTQPAIGRTNWATIAPYSSKAPQIMIRIADGTYLSLEEHLRGADATITQGCQPSVIVQRRSSP
jgi:hypothetical protein